MSIRAKLGLIRRMPRVDLFGARERPVFDPHSQRHWVKRKQFGGSKEWGERWGERQSFPPIGQNVRRMPFYLAMPSEPYNADWLHRREMVRLSLLDLQRLVDLGRIDPSRPVDLTNIANTKLFPLRERQYGYQLTDDGVNCLAARFVRLEVQHASEAAIAAVESRGGRLVCRFYDLASVAAKADPRAYFATGQPVPSCKLPPGGGGGDVTSRGGGDVTSPGGGDVTSPGGGDVTSSGGGDVISSALAYYSDPASRGYLAEPADIERCRLELAQKYGYALSPSPTTSGDGDTDGEKSPRQIFAGIPPGSVVSLADRLVYKPKSRDVLDYYQRPV